MSFLALSLEFNALLKFQCKKKFAKPQGLEIVCFCVSLLNKSALQQNKQSNHMINWKHLTAFLILYAIQGHHKGQLSTK